MSSPPGCTSASARFGEVAFGRRRTAETLGPAARPPRRGCAADRHRPALTTEASSSGNQGQPCRAPTRVETRGFKPGPCHQPRPSRLDRRRPRRQTNCGSPLPRSRRKKLLFPIVLVLDTEATLTAGLFCYRCPRPLTLCNPDPRAWQLSQRTSTGDLQRQCRSDRVVSLHAP